MRSKRRFSLTRADISGLLIGVRGKRIKGHFYLVETVRKYGGARQRDVRDADRLQEVARGEDGRPMRLRTPAIRRDRPTVQGSPALLSRTTSAGRVPADPPAKNHPV